MPQENKKSLYLTGRLWDVYNDTTRPQSFSKRVEQMVNRYQLILDETDVFTPTPEEAAIIGEAVQGSYIDRLYLRYFHDEIADVEQDSAKELAKKIEPLTIAQRLKLIEGLRL